MPAIPRSQPFAEQACPLGVCDGSGWILGPEDVARPCECRDQRLKRGRVRGVASAIPPRYRGVSFDRPPVSDMARDMSTRHVVNAVQAFVEELDENLAAGRGLWLMGNTGTGKTTLGMLAAKRGAGRRADGRRLLRAEAAHPDPPDLPGDRVRGRLRGLLPSASPRSTCSTSTTSAPSATPTGWSSSSTRWSTSATRTERSMLVTSNASRDVEEGRKALEEQIGSRTVSRLIEICDDPLPLFGADRREQRRAVGA